MFTYQAPNPYEETSSWLSFFSPLSRVSQTIGAKILPSQTRHLEEETEKKEQDLIKTIEEQHRVHIESGWVLTHDGARLQSIEISPNDEGDVSVAEKKYIIKFMGNWGLIQEGVNLDAFATDAAFLHANVVAFNYRGVGQSERKPLAYQDLITDGIAQVQRILDSGVDSKHILLDGRSLGGSVATVVAAHFHGQGAPMYLWNDRSFSSLTKAVAGKLLPEAGALKDMGEWVASGILYTSGWFVDVAHIYQSLPKEYKGYMFVAEASEQSKGDGTIAHMASLHSAIAPLEEREGVHTGHELFASKEDELAGHVQPRAVLKSSLQPSMNGQDIFTQFVHDKLGGVDLAPSDTKGPADACLKI